METPNPRPATARKLATIIVAGTIAILSVGWPEVLNAVIDRLTAPTVTCTK